MWSFIYPCRMIDIKVFYSIGNPKRRGIKKNGKRTRVVIGKLQRAPEKCSI